MCPSHFSETTRETAVRTVLADLPHLPCLSRPSPFPSHSLSLSLPCLDDILTSSKYLRYSWTYSIHLQSPEYSWVIYVVAVELQHRPFCRFPDAKGWNGSMQIQHPENVPSRSRSRLRLSFATSMLVWPILQGESLTTRIDYNTVRSRRLGY